MKQEILTGVLYMDEDTKELHHLLQTPDKALNTLTEKELCPGSEVLKGINKGLR